MINLSGLPKRYQQYYAYLEPVIADPLVRGYFSLVASFFLVAFFLVFALSPTVNTILSLQKKITDQKKLIAALETKKNNLILARENYQQVENQIPTLLTALPESPYPQTLVGEVTTIASASSGIHFDRFSIKKFMINGQIEPVSLEKFPEGVPGLSFSLVSSGPRDLIRPYLGKLENTLRYLRFNSLTFTLGKDGINVNAEGLGYYYQ